MKESELIAQLNSEIAQLQREKSILEDRVKDLRAACEQKQEIINANESLAGDVLKLKREKAELQRLCERAYLVIDENYEKLSDGEFGPSSLLKDLGKAKDGKELNDVNLLNDVLAKANNQLIEEKAELESRLLQFFNASDEPAMIRELYTKIANLEEEMKTVRSERTKLLQVAVMHTAIVERVKVLEKENGSKQAKIDSLMFEYCPDEMTKEQVEEWGKRQRRVPDCNDKDEEHDYIKGTSVVSRGRRMCRKCLMVEPDTQEGGK